MVMKVSFIAAKNAISGAVSALVESWRAGVAIIRDRINSMVENWRAGVRIIRERIAALRERIRELFDIDLSDLGRKIMM